MMVKQEEACCESGCCSGPKGGILVAALLLAIGMIVGSYLLAQGDYAPNVNVGPTNPNVYVSSIPPEHQISTSATASEKVAPDLLQIQLRVETTDTNAKKSQEDNAAVMAEVRSALKTAGLNDSDMQTVSYSVQPDYQSFETCDTTGKCHWDSEITGYTTTQTLMLDVKELDKGGDYIDTATSVGTNETFVDYVSFTLQDATRRSMEKELLKEASAEAKAKAQKIAEGLGVSLGKPLSASESYNYYPTPYYRNTMMDMAASAAPTVLSPGEVDVSVTVSVGYEIGG
ncbi:MAG: SIMPL domain-containing protein [Candidatus ainarchaeum sp.]|nr:SIMPL domain-containing protein [Candidatus ainarchaeum sp.]